MCLIFLVICQTILFRPTPNPIYKVQLAQDCQDRSRSRSNSYFVPYITKYRSYCLQTKANSFVPINYIMQSQGKRSRSSKVTQGKHKGQINILVTCQGILIALTPNNIVSVTHNHRPGARAIPQRCVSQSGLTYTLLSTPVKSYKARIQSRWQPDFAT